MIRYPVISTNVTSVGYNNGTLEVEFHNGSVYQYFHVPEYHFVNMVDFSHPGTYLARHIKNVYAYRRVS